MSNKYVTVVGWSYPGEDAEEQVRWQEGKTWSATVAVHDEVVVLGRGPFQSSRYNDPVSKR